jgi:hypothetical protein
MLTVLAEVAAAHVGRARTLAAATISRVGIEKDSFAMTDLDGL